MEKATAQVSSKKVMSEIMSLEPSTVIHLFEIDITDIATDLGILIDSDDVFAASNGIFRFHNNIKLQGTSIWWKDLEYFALPIEAEGFEFTSKSTPPTPKLKLSVADESVYILTTLKEKLYNMGDLSGAKVTRIRTFVKYLDSKNYLNQIMPFGIYEPDTNVELPRDVYYIDRKSRESKNVLEYELAPLFDIEESKLPGRIVNSTKCLHAYRGESCNYEYAIRATTVHSGATLPASAEPIANDKDELIKDIIGVTTFIDRGLWNETTIYNKGDAIYIQKNNIKYYFVAKVNRPITGPPNLRYWIPDSCSKSIAGCKLRFGSAIGLPFGGFPAVNKLAS